MNSIRRQLTLWITVGFLILWVLAGIGIYLSVQSGLMSEVDAQLSIDARVTRSIGRGVPDNEINDRLRSPVWESRLPPNYHTVGSGSYYQVWTNEGETVRQSESLGENQELTFPGADAIQSKIETVTWSNGTRLRVLHYSGLPEIRIKGKSGKRIPADPSVIVSMARDVGDIDRTLSILLIGIVGIGVLASVAMMGLIRLALNRSLKPLYELGEQSTSIDAGSLEARFDGTQAPVELDPVYERLNDLVERLQGSFERERRFSSDLAHEIRTPIAELKMMTEFAQKWPEKVKAETHDEYFDIALKLERTVDSIFTLARWESGNVDVNTQTVSLTELIQSNWNPFEGKSSSKKHQVQIQGPPNMEWETDPDLLSHIISNLLSNAVAYTPENGNIRVETSGNSIVISNQPHSLDDKDLPHLFDRYWRRDEARSDSSHAGLGLSLAASCAEVLALKLTASFNGEWLAFELSS